jgi:hypothetical protein
MRTSTPVCSGSIRVNIVGLPHLQQGGRSIAPVLIIFCDDPSRKAFRTIDLT